MVDVLDHPAADVLPPQEKGVHFSYSRPEQAFIKRFIIRAVERLTGQPRLERLYRAWTKDPRPGENIFGAGVRLLDLEIDYDAAAWAKVPRQGPVLFLANHPFGVVDGLVLGDLATRLRPDTCLMTHSLLCQPPEARDYLLPVDFGGTAQAQRNMLQTRRRTLDWLAAGHAVAVFPGGSVATAQRPLTGPALDYAWHPFVAKLAKMPEVTIIPVFFHGRNSRLFHLMSHTHYALRIALIFRETIRLIGKRVRVSVGEPIEGSALPQGDRASLMRHLRRLTLSLAGPGGLDPDAEFRWPRHIDPN